MRVWRLLPLLGVLTAMGAAAQTPVLADPETIRDCVCREARIETLRERMALAQRHYDEADAALKALDARVEAARPQIDPADQAQLDGFRRLLLEDEKARARFFNETLPHTQDVIARYNAERDTYVPRCTGIGYDPAVLAQVKAAPACPVQSLP